MRQTGASLPRIVSRERTCACGAPFTAYSADMELCDACQQERWREEAEARELSLQAERDREERERLAAIRADLPGYLGRCGTPPRYQGFTRAAWEKEFRPWEEHALTRELLEWPNGRPEDWLVVFYGRYGRRKTGLATALLGEAACAGARILWLDMNEWADALELGLGSGPWPSTAEVFERAKEAEVLLLDDLGAIRGARAGTRRGDEQAWWRERVALLLRHREMWIKPTIVTCNLTGDDPADKETPREQRFPWGLAGIDGSLVSRMTVRRAYEMEGPDYRARRVAALAGELAGEQDHDTSRSTITSRESAGPRPVPTNRRGSAGPGRRSNS